MLKRCAALAFAILAVAATPSQSAAPSQPPIPRVPEVHSGPEKPSPETTNGTSTQTQQRQGHATAFKTQKRQPGEQEREWKVDYQQRQTADEHALELGFTMIWVGVAQTVALVITFFVIAWVAIRQLRAYVVPGTTVFLHFSLTEPPIISVDFKNVGQTPAKRFAFNGNAFVAVYPLPKNSKMPRPVQPFGTGAHSITTLFPGADMPPTTVEMDCRHVLEPGAWDALMQNPPTAAIYVLGEAVYRDMFFCRRRTSFCRFVNHSDLRNLIESGGAPDAKGKWPARFIATHVMNEFT